MAKDFYKILGVERNASADEIKKAFRKLAHQHHPDKNGGDDTKFKEANEAYQTLSDEKKRAQYDQFGQTFSGGGPQGNPFQGGGFDFSGFQQGGVNFDMDDLGDIFGDFFGGGGGRGRERRGRDIATEITISFKDSIFGTKRTVLLSKVSTCKTCSGSGGKPGSKKSTCSKCNGKGSIRQTRNSFFGAMSTNVLCDVCTGSGETYEHTCESCRGNGVLQNQEEITIAIPAGIQTGEMVRMYEFGEAVKGGISGDLYIKINVTADKTFKRVGRDIHMNLEVKLSETLLGNERTVETLDGSVKVVIPEGIRHGETIKVKNYGVGSEKGKRGDLVITCQVLMPQKLNKKTKELIEELKKEGI